jgi:Tfp pilus assembly protein PilO
MTTRRLKFDIRQAGRPILAVLVAWFLLCSGFYLVQARPQVQRYRSLVENSEPRRQALAARRAEVEYRESFLEKLQQAESDLSRFREEVLSTRELRLVSVQRELTKLCARFNIDLETVTLDHDDLLDEELNRMAMVVPLEGGYANLRKFLQAVESSEQFLLVEKVGLGKGKEGGVMLQLDITLVTYFDLSEAVKRKLERLRRGARRT